MEQEPPVIQAALFLVFGLLFFCVLDDWVGRGRRHPPPTQTVAVVLRTTPLRCSPPHTEWVAGTACRSRTMGAFSLRQPLFERGVTLTPTSPSEGAFFFAATLCHCKGAGGQARARFEGAEERRTRGRARKRASSSDSSALFDHSEQRERREFADGPRVRAPQGSRPTADRLISAPWPAHPRLCPTHPTPKAPKIQYAPQKATSTFASSRPPRPVLKALARPAVVERASRTRALREVAE